MKKFILTPLFLVFSILTNAQVNTYSFQNSGSTFPYLTGIPGAIITEHIINDDYVSPANVSLPFTFMFGGAVQNSIGISENGFIWFGSVDPNEISSVFYPISNSQNFTTVEGVISALGIDLHPINTNTAVTKIRSAVIGVAPNRKFVVEWYHTSRISTIYESNGPDEMDFQIRLLESTNKVEIAFGRFFMNPDLADDIEVGMKTSDTDFINRTNQNSTWSNTSAGTFLTSSCLLSNTSKPAIGQYFTWSPNNLSVEDLNFESIEIYPVPTNETIYINGLEENDTSYVIYDLTGREISKGNVIMSSIPVSALSSGNYIIYLSQGIKKTTRRFIKS